VDIRWAGSYWSGPDLNVRRWICHVRGAHEVYRVHEAHMTRQRGAVSVTIGEHFERFIERLIQERRYETPSEIVREALSLLDEKEQDRDLALESLRHDIRIGLASGEGKPAEVVLDRLRAKYQAMADSAEGEEPV
jgi:antitoxin ParD1/3/4